MGRDKALVEVGGRALAAGVAHVLGDAGAAEVFVVGGDLGALGDLGLQAIPDGHPGEGPLGGLLSALRHASEAVVVVLACDLPRTHARAVRRVVAEVEADPTLACAVPMVDGHLQPLHGAWRRSALPELEAAFDRGERALHRVVAALAWAEVPGIDPGAVVDVDTPSDIDTLDEPIPPPI